MKIRTSIQAGGTGCSPETLHYMNKALKAQAALDQCLAQRKPYTAPAPVANQNTSTYIGNVYPDMSGLCG